MGVEQYINKTFTFYHDARAYIMNQGFDYFGGIPINMGEGYEHIFIYEYRHKTKLTICRMADLRMSMRKLKDTDTIPDLIDFIQVSIKNIND